MGNKKIQAKIGNKSFDDQNMATKETNNLCSNNCELKEENCGFWAKIFSTLLNAIGLKGTFVSCPLNYYDCKGEKKFFKLICF